MPVYRPVRGVIDLVLADADGRASVVAARGAQSRSGAPSISSGGRREKADALPSADGWPWMAFDRATVAAACWSCDRPLRCARSSEPRPDRFAAAYPGQHGRGSRRPLTARRPGPGAAIVWVERRARRRAAGSSTGRPAGSPSGDEAPVTRAWDGARHTMGRVKKIGFLSFGHWTASPYSQVRTASDALLQSIELAVAAEELGADGAYFRVHHFARQLGSPFPLLAAVGARTKTHRDRHRRHRHALREPAVHGRGRRARPTSSPAAGSSSASAAARRSR